MLRFLEFFFDPTVIQLSVDGLVIDLNVVIVVVFRLKTRLLFSTEQFLGGTT